MPAGVLEVLHGSQVVGRVQRLTGMRSAVIHSESLSTGLGGNVGLRADFVVDFGKVRFHCPLRPGFLLHEVGVVVHTNQGAAAAGYRLIAHGARFRKSPVDTARFRVPGYSLLSPSTC